MLLPFDAGVWDTSKDRLPGWMNDSTQGLQQHKHWARTEPVLQPGVPAAGAVKKLLLLALTIDIIGCWQCCDAVDSNVISGQLNVGRKPFFVRGVYASEVMQSRPASKPSDLHAKYDNLRLIKSAGFNTILSYAYGATRPPSQMKAFLDEAHANGLFVIISIRIYSNCRGHSCKHIPDADQHVRDTVLQHKEHPAVLMWYINDEQGASNLLVERYRNVSRWDGKHAVLQVAGNWVCFDTSSCARNLSRYSDSTDVLGIDPYIWSNHTNTHNLSSSAINLVANFKGLTSAFGRNGTLGSRYTNLCVTQIHDLRNYHGGRYTEPPYAVKRACAFAAIACGCQGLLQYSYMDLFRNPRQCSFPPTNATIARRLHELSQLGGELASLEPFLLSTPPKVPVMLTPTLPGKSTLAVVRHADGLGRRVFLVNGNDQAQAVTFTIDRGETHKVWMEPWDVQILRV